MKSPDVLERSAIGESVLLVKTDQRPKTAQGLSAIGVIYETVIAPDLEGVRETGLLLVDTTIEVNSSNRISAPEAPQEAEKTSPLPNIFNDELQAIDALQKSFNQSLGIEDWEEQAATGKNYNPVLDRHRYEQLTTETWRTQFREFGFIQAQTALRERYGAAQSVIRYEINESGKLRNSKVPNEPLETTLQRGIAYRKSINSPDVPRMERELNGVLKLEGKLADKNTSLGSKAVVISGPGLIEGTIFTENFVDIYQLKFDPETNQRYVEMSRFASKVDYEGYEQKALNLKPDYLANFIGSIDGYFLENPILMDGEGDLRDSQQVFEQVFGGNSTALKEDQMKEILLESKARISFYLDALTEAIFNPEKVAIAWNAVLNGADLVRQRFKDLTQRGKEDISRISHVLVGSAMRVFTSIREEVEWLGRQTPAEIAAACGISGGFKIRGRGRGLKSLVSSLTKGLSGLFGGKDKYGDLEFECPKCGRTNTRNPNELRSNCEHCGDDVRC